MIQAIVWALVLTSGAGMSRSGPIRTSISVAKRRRQVLELTARQLLGVDDHAALAAAEGDAHDGALPGHPHREGLDLVDADVLVVADAALGRAATQVVLDAVALEDLDDAVVHLDREVDVQLAPGLTQDLAQAGVEVELLGGDVELLLRHVPRVDGRRCSLGGHVDRDPPEAMNVHGPETGAESGRSLHRGSCPTDLPEVTEGQGPSGPRMARRARFDGVRPWAG